MVKLDLNFNHPFNNLCYVMSEALYHRWGKKHGLRPFYAKLTDQPGVKGGVITHWWLQDATGKVYDLTAGQFNGEFPYHLGKGCGFLTKEPSARCQVLLETLDAVRWKPRRKHGIR